MGTKLKTAYVLSFIIVILTAIASAGGLLIPNLYRDNSFVISTWRGNDFVTLFVAVPIMLVGLILSMRGSFRALLVWLGMLDYTLYYFAFYLFGAAFNRFFLIYVALFALSIYAIIFALTQIDVKEIKLRFQESTPVKLIGGYMLFVAIGLSTVYFAMCLNFINSGELPAIITLTGHPTNVVFALDFSLLVPVLVLGGIWIWQRKPWGYVLAVIANVKGPVYTLALTASTITAIKAKVVEAPGEIPLWSFLTVTGMIACLILLWNIKSTKVK